MTNYSLNMMILVYLIKKEILPRILDPHDPAQWINYEMQYAAQRNPRFGSVNVSLGKPLPESL